MAADREEHRRRLIEREEARRIDPRLLGLPRPGSPEAAWFQARLAELRTRDRSRDEEVPF